MKTEYVPVRVRVTKRDILKGNKGEEDSCPIARAVKRVVVDNARVHVGGEDIGIAVGQNIRYNKDLPSWAQSFVELFDDSLGRPTGMACRRTLHLPKSVVKRFGR